MAEMDVTTVALVNGRSLGGGCELMAFCDIVIASEKARIGQPEIAVGVFPPVAAAWFPKIIGLKKTYELLLTGKVLTAKEAEAIGLVNVVLPVENFKADVDKFLADFLNKSRPVAMWTKTGNQGRPQPRFSRGPQGFRNHLSSRLYEDRRCQGRHYCFHGKKKSGLEG